MKYKSIGGTLIVTISAAALVTETVQLAEDDLPYDCPPTYDVCKADFPGPFEPDPHLPGNNQGSFSVTATSSATTISVSGVFKIGT